jgi:hypothetical protein
MDPRKRIFLIVNRWASSLNLNGKAKSKQELRPIIETALHSLADLGKALSAFRAFRQPRK